MTDLSRLARLWQRPALVGQPTSPGRWRKVGRPGRYEGTRQCIHNSDLRSHRGQDGREPGTVPGGDVEGLGFRLA